MTTKILIGAPTTRSKEYCFNEFIQGIKNQSHTKYDIVVAISHEEKDYQDELKKRGLKVIEWSGDVKAKIERIVNARNIIRKFFLKGGYDYLLWIDSDIVLPPNAVEKLLSHEKELVTGVYAGRLSVENTTQILPVLYGLTDDPEFAGQYSMDAVLGDDFFEIAAAGLGCCLVKRNVLEKVNIRYYKDTMAGEDIAFFEDSRKAGFKAYADTSVKCRHMEADGVLEVAARDEETSYSFKIG